MRDGWRRRSAQSEGVALVMVVLTLALALTLAAGLALSTSTEVQVAANFRGSGAAWYAADAAAEWAVVDLAVLAPDWPAALAGSVQSSLIDGAAVGTRTLPDGSSLDLSAAIAQARGWRVYAHGWLRDLLPPPAAPAGASPFYVLVFLAADPDSAEQLRIRAEAFGPRGAHRAAELTLRRDSAGVHTTAWSDGR